MYKFAFLSFSTLICPFSVKLLKINYFSVNSLQFRECTKGLKIKCNLLFRLNRKKKNEAATNIFHLSFMKWINFVNFINNANVFHIKTELFIVPLLLFFFYRKQYRYTSSMKEMLFHLRINFTLIYNFNVPFIYLFMQYSLEMYFIAIHKFHLFILFFVHYKFQFICLSALILLNENIFVRCVLFSRNI